MDRQLTIRREGERYHLIFHNFQGPFEGRQIADFLELQEVDPPSEEDHEKAPGLNQFFLWDAMGFHPDLHSQVDEDKLPHVAELVKRMHLHVMEGEEYLPEAAAPNAGLKGSQTDLPEHHSITEELEKLHESVWHKGPKEIAKAFVIRLVPLAIIIFLGMIVMRHIGDPYTEMSMKDAWHVAKTPVPEQGAFDMLWNPDKSHMVRVKLSSANYAGGNRVICADGDVLRFEGVHDIRGVLKQASGYSGLPEIDAEAQQGRLQIRKMTAGNTILLSQGTIVRDEILPRTAPKPSRAAVGSENGFWDYDAFDLDDKWSLEEAANRRVSLEGIVVKQDTVRVLRFGNGAGVKLNLDKEGTPSDKLLALFEGDPGTIQVDGILTTVYPLENDQDPARSRQASKLVGELTVYSVSAQNYHAVDRR